MCGVHGFDKQKAQQRTAEMISEFNLGGIIKKKASKLSGGWQRRLSIAMALISEPQILFLDEPTLGLDVIARSELWDTIRELKGKMTIILTTHYMEEAEELSDRIGVMKDGHLLAVGTSQELKDKTGEEKFENAFIKLVKGGAR
jgi:ABC-2 type transport system ATP-binding protein